MATKVASRSMTTAIAIAGRASRACDVCANKSARWYCGADTAYLCDRCDTQVHSANALAKRHERVRLTVSGVPMKSSRKVTVTMADHDEDSEMPRKQSSLKKCHSAPVQVMSSRKRSRTSRPHPLKRRASEAKPTSKVSKVEDVKVKEELLTFSDIFDTEDFLVDDTQEVPAFITVAQDSSPSSSEFDLSSPELSPEFRSDFYGVCSPSEDSFAAYFKGKAAHNDFSDDVMADQFVVPDGVFDNCLDSGVNICCDVDSSISIAGDACFIPGDIPGLDGYEDDYSLCFHLALRDASPDSFGEDSAATATATVVHPTNNAVSVEADQFGNGPFAKFFAKKPKGEKVLLSPENIKSEAKEILRCSLEGLSEEDLRTAPTLRLNYEDVLTAWSDRGEPWVNPENSTDVGLVPDMGEGGADDDQTGGGREARVLRYKEKRRSRLFSKTIRYEVRKLNAERRPRMKGRFVKRT
ncbi:zinc finger protein CONSTANS-LIKE 16 isoform X2 [Physcomitrium patens]|uniref:Uncharacterized protein n=1 Tax=Physcomitrium patens TaxID=3218 RepID=A0A2K1KCT7_PHYPA|nr:zinc finger protein CONSTANS-LIKE 16-like isoform X2 [Physcomitrium patens]PNR51597.1 hypothetical protein PHYPA_010784 [Physcomitrium patens]|eukprot:XP_024380508.1 zinc finger protein CONSTANS-LIKE 16-like isoform X2 [Physcomitrella patens]